MKRHPIIPAAMALALIALASMTLRAIADDKSALPESVLDTDFRQYPESQIALGRLLFYDRIFSGTYRVSCATCHHHDRASSNGELLPEVKAELTEDEMANAGATPYAALKPSARHAPALFNLGAKEFTTLFSDGRVAVKSDGDFISPAKGDLPEGLRDVLAVQALFPAVTGDELVGTVDNDIADVAHLGNRAIWEALAARVRGLSEYQPYFRSAFPQVNKSSDITIVEVANAISAFVGSEWRSTNSPFDRYLRGNKDALTPLQKEGMALFYGDAGCSTCHSGPFQTDHEFHAVAMPPLDIKKLGDPEVAVLPRGRQEVTGKSEDRDKIRTPTLRNVWLTAPYGHAGQVEKLSVAIMHHYAPVEMMREAALNAVGENNAVANGRLLEEALIIGRNSELKTKGWAAADMEKLLAFLESLTDEKGARGQFGKPKEVPSSLVLD